MATGFRTKKRNPPERKKITSLEVGDTGTRILDGVISEEYNSKLVDQRGIAIYEEMRKSDGTVRAALQAVKLPVRSAEWYVKPGTEDDQGKEIADFVWRCLSEYQDRTFSELLRHALLALDFGVMPFEKVYELREVDGTERIVWAKLAPRMPKSIQKWAIAQSAPGITQVTSDGKTVEIPMEKLIVFVNEKEGDNWWGTSLLRAAYKPWFIKTSLEKIDAIGHERQGVGIPRIKLPENASKSDKDQAETIAKNIRANSQAHIVQPDGYEVEFMDMKASGTRDASPSLAYHSREIMKAMLVQFLELGSTAAGGTGGSRALSEDHSRLFLQSEEAIARWFSDTMKPHIKELVDLNFDGITEYPCLEFEGITAEDMTALSTTYNTLKNASVITPQDADEAAFREKLGLPELDEGGIRDEEPIDQSDPTEASERRHVKKNFAEGFKPFRKLTFAEQKVNFQSLHDKMNELEEQFDSATRELLDDARKEYMTKFTRAALAGDTQAIKDATLKVQNDYARILKSAIKTSFEFGKTNAAKEIGVDAPGNPADILRQIDIQSAAIADQQIAEIVTDSKNAYVEALNKGQSAAAALAAADAAAGAAIDRLTRDSKAILVSGYINHGRDTVFDRNADDIYALQRSELLDTHTCNYCISIDGRVIEKDDPFGRNTIFHSNCRGIWVAILQDEEEKPNIAGIPQSLRDRFGDAVNDLLQPKRGGRGRRN